MKKKIKVKTKRLSLAEKIRIRIKHAPKHVTKPEHHLHD
jgi:hypothetical protein